MAEDGDKLPTVACDCGLTFSVTVYSRPDEVDGLRCPYCGEMARLATDGTDLAALWKGADAVDEEVGR